MQSGPAFLGDNFHFSHRATSCQLLSKCLPARIAKLRIMLIMSARRGFLTVMQDVFLWLRWKFSGTVAGPHLEAMTA